MRIVFKAPGEDPRQMEIPNELGVMQQLVNGHIETVKVDDNVVLVCNDSGQIFNMKPNFYVGALASVICGPAFFVGDDGGDEFVSLSKENADFIEGILRGGFDI